MTYEQYWHGDPWLVRAYAQAYLLRRKVDNEQAWIQGAYIANAVTVAIANTFGKKKTDYLKKPLEIFPKTESEKKQEIREEKKRIIAWLNKIAKSSKQKKTTGSDQNGES